MRFGVIINAGHGQLKRVLARQFSLSSEHYGQRLKRFKVLRLNTFDGRRLRRRQPLVAPFYGRRRVRDSIVHANQCRFGDNPCKRIRRLFFGPRTVFLCGIYSFLRLVCADCVSTKRRPTTIVPRPLSVRFFFLNNIIFITIFFCDPRVIARRPVCRDTVRETATGTMPKR